MLTFQFEVWNELWGMTPANQSDSPIAPGSPYMKLYNASAVAIKSVNPKLRVGGSASNGDWWQDGSPRDLRTFMRSAKSMGAAFDFVSGHIYPTSPSPAGHPCGPIWNPDCMRDNVRNISEVLSKAGVPLLITEYAVAGVENGASSTQLDSESAAAFVFRTIGRRSQLLDFHWDLRGAQLGGFPRGILEQLRSGALFSCYTHTRAATACRSKRAIPVKSTLSPLPT
jgi:hypothetical protein